MSEDLHDIDNLFRDSIESYEDEPSEKVWNDIDKNLDADNTNALFKKYRNLKIASSILLFLFLGTLVYHFISGDSKNIQTTINSNNLSINQDKLTDASKHHAIHSDVTANNNIAGSLKDNTQRPDSAVSSIPGNQHNSSNSNQINKQNFDQSSYQNFSANKKIRKQISGKTRITITSSNEIAEQTNTIENRNRVVPNRVELIAISKQSSTFKLLDNAYQSPQISNAKNVETIHDHNSKISISAFYSPHIVKMHLQESHEQSKEKPDLDESKGVKNKISYSTGILIDYAINKKWAIQSGIVYNNYNFSIAPKKLYADLDYAGNVKYKFECSAGYWYVKPKSGTNPVIGDSVQTNISTVILNYVSIPLALKYTIPFRKISLFTSTGLAVNFLSGNKISSEIETSSENEAVKTKEMYGLKSCYLSGNLTVGASYKLTNQVACSLSPSYYFAINQITKNLPIKSYPNVFGISAGITYRF